MTIVSCLFECFTQHIQLNILKLRSPLGIIIICSIRVSWIVYGTFSFWNLELHRFCSSRKILCIKSISRQREFQPIFQNSWCAFIQNLSVLNFFAWLRKCEKRTTALQHSHYDHSCFLRLSQERTILLKQQLSIMDKWLTKTEREMKKDEQIGHNYETTKKQLDEHQVMTNCKNKLE